MGMAAVIYKKGAPPTNVMNSRLFMPPGRQSYRYERETLRDG